ncbi:hypothetical protein [Nocardia sp. NPDC004711]
MEAVRLSGADLARLSVGGPTALEGVMCDPFRPYLAREGFASATQTTYHKRARGFLKWLIRVDTHPEALTDSAARDDAVLEYLSTTTAATRKGHLGCDPCVVRLARAGAGVRGSGRG